jgi:hypothetical protein
MNTELSIATGQQTLKRVATNLYRSSQSGVYYAIFKRKRRQVKRSLRTTNRELARRRLDELRHKIDRLKSGDAKTLPFAEYDDQHRLIGGLAKRWLDITSTTIDPSTRDRYLDNIKQLSSFLHGIRVGNIGLNEVDDWAKARAPQCSAETFNKERDVFRRILEHGV